MSPGSTSKSESPSTTYDGRIDLDAAQSPTHIENFDFDNMKINDLDIEAGIDSGIITECWDRTPLHMAIAERRESVIRCFIDYKGENFVYDF